jgi:hypothetical protein
MTTNSPVSFTRRHVLGDLYLRCDSIEDQIPVFLNSAPAETIGHVDESLGKYRDAFSFHVPDDVCKLLVAGHYTYSFECEHATVADVRTSSRVFLRSITLTSKKGYDKPIARRGSAAAAEKE